MLNSRVSFVVVAALTIVSSLRIEPAFGSTGLSDAEGDGARAEIEYRLDGGEAVLWFLQSRTDAADVTRIEMAYRRASKPDRFVPLFTVPLVGRVVATATMGTSLHVFFQDGSHRRFALPSRSLPVVSERLHRDESLLPQSAVPALFCSDAKHQMLYAVVTSEKAVAAQTKRLSDPYDDDDLYFPGAQRRPSPRPRDRPAPQTEWSLLRYEAGSWHYDRDAPSGVGRDAVLELLLVREGAAHLFFRAASGGRVRHVVSAGPDAKWQPPAAISTGDSQSVLAGGWLGDRPIVVVGLSIANRVSIELLEYADAAWSVRSTLGEPGVPGIRADQPHALAVVGRAIVTATMTDDGQPQIVSWSAETGALIGEPKPISSFSGRRPFIDSTTVSAVQMFLMFAVLSGVLVWRRNRMFSVDGLPSGLRVAGLGRRMAAHVLDILMSFPLWGPALNALWSGNMFGFSLRDVARGEVGADTTGFVFWGMVVLGAVIGFYGMVFEAVMATTPGKRLLGLTVVTESGDRCRLSGAIIRNLMRVVEFQLLPIVIFVFITPSRQRVGDLMARTVVVEMPVPSGGPPVEGDGRQSTQGPDSDEDRETESD